MRPRRSPALLAVLAALAPILLVAGIWLGGHPENLPGFARDALVGDEQAQVVRAAMDQIERDYYRKVDEKTLSNTAIGGMVDSLHDRYSRYFSPTDYQQFQRDSNAQFAGVGIEVSEDKRGLRIVRVYDNSPAQRARLHVGDVIVGADGHDLGGLTSTKSSAFIRGKPGSDVRLTILGTDGRRRTENLTRALVSAPVVASRMRRTAGGVAVAQVALATFSSGAHGQLRAAIDRRLKQGAKGILLDLRGNGGGLLDEARLVASIFIADGTIVTVRGRTQPTRTLTATGGAIPGNIPVDVLVDRDTASSAEIVSGAIEDRGRGQLVGGRTYGKGVFQQVRQLPNGGALDLTVGEYFLPSGRNLGGGGVKRGQGIQPDVTAPDDPKTRADETVSAALRDLAKRLAK